MITIMISGTIAKQPETRTSKTGSPFTNTGLSIGTNRIPVITTHVPF